MHRKCGAMKKLEEVTRIERIKESAGKDVLLTVWVLTYNHALYIGQALDSILSQKTNFKFDIMIFDDASTDGTSDIIREYAHRYPNVIRAYLLETNTFYCKSRIKMREAFNREVIKSKYVAFCEGDDYWSDNNKLQLQVDFLEKNDSCVMTWHSARKLDCRDNSFSLMKPFNEGYVSEKDIIMETNCIIPVASAVCKSEVFLIKDDFPEGPVGDKKIWLNAILNGKSYYIDKEMSVYRYMHNNSWSINQTESIINKSRMNLRLAHFFMEFNTYSKGAFSPFPLHKAACYICDIAEDELIETESSFLEIYQVLSEQFSFIQPLKSQLLEIYRIVHISGYINENIKEYCTKHKKVYVYGAGKFGQKIFNALKAQNLNVCGYIVSDNVMIGKESTNVYRFSQIELTEDVGVVVAVNNYYRNEIEKVLADNNYCDYYTPFWLNNI